MAHVATSLSAQQSSVLSLSPMQPSLFQTGAGQHPFARPEMASLLQPSALVRFLWSTNTSSAFMALHLSC